MINLALTPDDIQTLLRGQAGPPPSGLSPNSGEASNLNIASVVTCAVTIFIATVAIAIRVFTKSHIIRVFHLEDCKYRRYNIGIQTNSG